MFGIAETIVKKRRAIDALEAEWVADVGEYDRSGDVAGRRVLQHRGRVAARVSCRSERRPSST